MSFAKSGDIIKNKKLEILPNSTKNVISILNKCTADIKIWKENKHLRAHGGILLHEIVKYCAAESRIFRNYVQWLVFRCKIAETRETPTKNYINKHKTTWLVSRGLL